MVRFLALPRSQILHIKNHEPTPSYAPGVVICRIDAALARKA